MYEDGPGCADRDCGQHGQERMRQAAQKAPLPQQPRRQHQGRDRKPQKPLGQKGAARRQSREQCIACVARHHRPMERDDRGGEKQRQQIVEHVERTDHVDFHEGEIDRCGEDAGLRTAADRPGKPEHQQARSVRLPRRSAGAPRTRAPRATRLKSRSPSIRAVASRNSAAPPGVVRPNRRCSASRVGSPRSASHRA